MSSTIKQVHDRFFKEAFSRPEVVNDFVRAFLPDEFTRSLRLETLSRKQDSHIDEEMSQHYVDLLYSVEFGTKPIVIALLLEHKSYPEVYPHFQLNRYLLNFWADQIKEKKPLQHIVPIVIYHGSRPWKQRSMKAYFTQTDLSLAQFVPDFQYYLINLSKTQDAKFSLLQSSYAKLTAGLLRTIRHKEQLKRMIESLAQSVAQLAEEPLGAGFLRTVFVYVSASSGLTRFEVLAIFRNISSQTDQIAMSAYEEWIQEGVQQGMQQGMHETTMRHIKGMMRVGMDAKTIAPIIDLPLATVKQYIKLIEHQSK